jgi:2-polyprenyl-6-methoxyphenol hydroxylase-like FAD-dependent oxidoreductase
MQRSDFCDESRQAIVIGGSMAGLLAARVLSDHFDQVTIVERDRLPNGPAFRPGVPQSRHAHALPARGQQLLEQLFPGLGAELDAAGAVSAEIPGDVLWMTAAGWCHRFQPGLQGICLSRELLEWQVRRRLLGPENMVCFREEADVIGLVPSQDRRAVVGVRVRPRGRGPMSAAHVEELPADLVIDASGRTSRTRRWLEALGYPAPKETHINSLLGYASRYYARPHGARRDWTALYIMAAPGAPRGGLILPIEGDRWLVTLSGYGGDYPPTDEEGFLAFARSLRSELLFEAIKDAEPLSAIVGNRFSENRLCHYDRMPRRPERLLVLGDAVCAFNPVYGQGMTMAACAATVLDDCLWEQDGRYPGGELTGLAKRFQRQLARSNATAWLMATVEDLRYPTTTGAKPTLATRLLHRYVDRVIHVSAQNRAVSRVFFEVMNMVTPATALLRPDVLIPVLLESGRPGLMEAPTGGALSLALAELSGTRLAS